MAATRWLLAALLLACACGGACAATMEVESVQIDDKGGKYIMTDDNHKWMVLQKEGEDKLMFLNDVTKEIAYVDPRTIPNRPTENLAAQVKDVQMDDEGNYFIDAGKPGKFLIFVDQEKRMVYFHNPDTGVTQWEDPRMPAEGAKKRRKRAKAPDGKPPPEDSLRVASIALVPVLLFTGALAARLFYLHTNHPELLFPTKERKERRRTAGGKMKAQKTRGKMNQDGKGGRSANS